MIIKRISNYKHTMGKEEFNKITAETPVDNKHKILAYLKRFDDCAFTSQPVYDIYGGEQVFDADNAKTDGVYTWYQSEIYHFEKYDLQLNDDFIHYLTDNGYLD